MRYFVFLTILFFSSCITEEETTTNLTNNVQAVVQKIILIQNGGTNILPENPCNYFDSIFLSNDLDSYLNHNNVFDFRYYEKDCVYEKSINDWKIPHYKYYREAIFYEFLYFYSMKERILTEPVTYGEKTFSKLVYVNVVRDDGLPRFNFDMFLE